MLVNTSYHVAYTYCHAFRCLLDRCRCHADIATPCVAAPPYITPLRLLPFSLLLPCCCRFLLFIFAMSHIDATRATLRYYATHACHVAILPRYCQLRLFFAPPLPLPRRRHATCYFCHAIVAMLILMVDVYAARYDYATMMLSVERNI